MRATLARRLILWIGGPAMVLFAILMGTASWRSYRQALDQAERLTRSMSQLYAARLDARFSKAAKIAEMHAQTLESWSPESESLLEGYLRNVVATNTEIYGSCLAFEPNQFSSERHYYAPYFYKDGAEPKFVQLGNAEYDYFHWDWYRQPKAQNMALWTEPYFDEGGGNTLMTTYSVPFRRNGQLWGIATIDISMTQLVAETETIAVGKTGYAFLISKGGRFIAYPQKVRTLRETLQEAIPAVAGEMLAGRHGFIRTTEPLNKQPAWVAFAPVQNGGFSLALVYPEAEILRDAFALEKELLIFGGIMLLALAGGVIFVARSITAPITELARAAQAVAQGNLKQRIHVPSATEEVQHLADAFRKMMRDLEMRMTEVRYNAALQARISGELIAARSIQMSLLPKRPHTLPQRPEYDLDAVVKAARAVGGDFYDLQVTDDDRLCWVIADVSGKGIPAALLMAVTKTLLKAAVVRTRDAAEMLSTINSELFDQGETGMFVSLLHASLDLRSGILELTNAGHPAPIRVSTAGYAGALETAQGIALGAWRNAEYATVRHQLAPGDVVFFYTDGITEAANASDEFFGIDRLCKLLGANGGASAEHVTQQVVDEVRAFGGSAEQSDDMTVLVVRWNGPCSGKE